MEVGEDPSSFYLYQTALQYHLLHNRKERKRDNHDVGNWKLRVLHSLYTGNK